MRWLLSALIFASLGSAVFADGTNTVSPAPNADPTQERAQLQTELDQRNKELFYAEAQANKAAAETAQQQVNALRSRIAALDATLHPKLPPPVSPAPVSTPTVAAAPATVGSTNTAAPGHTSMELPAGSGALMADATMAMRAGDYKGAEAKYNDVLRQDENNVYVLDFLAGVQFEAGEFDACEKTVLRATRIDPNDAKSLYVLGVLRYRQNRLDDALAALRRSAQYNPTNAGTQNYLGVVLGEKGQNPAAESAFRKALAADPNNADAHYNLAYIYASEAPPFLELARWHYHRALDLGHPKNEPMEKLLAAQKQ